MAWPAVGRAHYTAGTGPETLSSRRTGVSVAAGEELALGDTEGRAGLSFTLTSEQAFSGAGQAFTYRLLRLRC